MEQPELEPRERPAPLPGLIDPAVHRSPAYPPDPGPAGPVSKPTPEPTTEVPVVEELDLAAPASAWSAAADAVRRHALVVAVLLVAATMAVVGVRYGLHRARDARETFDQAQVMAAMTAFRTSSSDSAIRAVVLGSGARRDELAVDPAVCTPLFTLVPTGALGGATWTDISGPTYDSTQLQILRFADPATARDTLAALSGSVAGCTTSEVTFNSTSDSGDDPIEQGLQRGDAGPAPLGARDRFAYDRQIADAYSYYVRQYGNTVIWVYGSALTPPQVRFAAAEDLIAQLALVSAHH